ncbi:MAG: HAD family hydrolase [Dehalococcoidia bacterium]|nr:MAG: HAD family hydrolase [Dehalococcoidia bacterium]
MTTTMALFDLDGTLCSGHLWEGFIKYYFKHKKKRAWILAFWAIHLALWPLVKCKLLSREKYTVKWMEDLCGIFRGESSEEVLGGFRWVTDNYMVKSLRSDVVDILEWHKQSGHIVAIVSATSTALLETVGQRLGVPNIIGTKLEVVDGTYTGRVVKPVCFGENKAKLLEQFIRQNGLKIDLSSSFAYADSIFDVPLLKLVGNPVATYPDKSLRQLAEDNNWRILP